AASAGGRACAVRGGLAGMVGSGGDMTESRRMSDARRTRVTTASGNAAPRSSVESRSTNPSALGDERGDQDRFIERGYARGRDRPVRHGDRDLAETRGDDGTAARRQAAIDDSDPATVARV